MSHSPAISVIMPVYNTAQYLREAIDSILNQTFTDFEFIIIDDASTDGSKEIIKSYSDDRIILIENEINQGYVFGLNYAISIAKGEYIARMDSDDISIAERLLVQFKFMERNSDVIVCGSNIKIINSLEEVYYPENHLEIKIKLLSENPVAHPSVLIRKKAICNLNWSQEVYDYKMVPSEDYALWTKLVFFGNFYNIQKSLLMYRRHDSQISSKKSDLQFLKFQIIRRAYVLNFYSSKYKIPGTIESYSDSRIPFINDFFIIDMILKQSKMLLDPYDKLFLQKELNYVKANILSCREINTFKKLIYLIFVEPRVLIVGDKRILFSYLKRLIIFAFLPEKRSISPYLMDYEHFR